MVMLEFLLGTDRTVQKVNYYIRILTETEAQSLLTHYNGQNGSIDPRIYLVQWAGYTTPPVSSSDYKWRYDSFQISISAPSKYATSIELISVPI